MRHGYHRYRLVVADDDTAIVGGLPSLQLLDGAMAYATSSASACALSAASFLDAATASKKRGSSPSPAASSSSPPKSAVGCGAMPKEG
jgi:hypothetical protein